MNLEMIKAEFDLKGSSSFELKKELMQKMALIHPDKNKGEFVNDTDKELFHKMNTAVEFIDKNKTSENSLITINEAKDLVEHFAKQVSLVTQTAQISSSLSKSADKSLNTIRNRYKLPKITSAAATVAVSALWLFPNQVKEHPILGELFNINSKIFFVFWVYLLVTTVLIWFHSHMKEQNQEQFLKKVKSTQFQNFLFSQFIKNENRSSENQMAVFSKSDFTEYLTLDSRSWNRIQNRSVARSLFYTRPEIDIDITEVIADSVFSRAEEKGLIQRIKSSSLEDEYRLIPTDQR